MLCVEDFMQGNRMASFQEICNKIGVTPSRFLEYSVVCNAVKTFLRKFDVDKFCEMPQIPMFHNAQIYRASDFRKFLVSLKVTDPCSVSFWKRKFNIEIDETVWKIAYNCTQETRLRLLHWKLVHNIYPTNIMLLKMKVTENNKCSYCSDTLDVIEHFLFECPLVQAFWQQIVQYILVSYDVKITLGVTEALFGIRKNGNNLSTLLIKKINHIMLVAKMCISIFKKTKSSIPLMLLFEKNILLRNME